MKEDASSASRLNFCVSRGSSFAMRVTRGIWQTRGNALALKPSSSSWISLLFCYCTDKWKQFSTNSLLLIYICIFHCGSWYSGNGFNTLFSYLNSNSYLFSMSFSLISLQSDFLITCPFCVFSSPQHPWPTSGWWGNSRRDSRRRRLGWRPQAQS